ncbi:hypothetical protein [Noviherbaspirillum soli]|uniref:hypothetical protein n=1 Tax=Noviherbaspirillum soli TaxID=1064518 RepID=UPI00188CFA77|nr:hypothetical protein [Noviherbaspirillum soli]
MEDKVHQQPGLVLIDIHIEELEQRLNALQEVIVAMTAAGSDSSEQAELMLKMLRVRHALATFRMELAEDVLARHDDGEAS